MYSPWLFVEREKIFAPIYCVFSWEITMTRNFLITSVHSIRCSAECQDAAEIALHGIRQRIEVAAGFAHQDLSGNFNRLRLCLQLALTGCENFSRMISDDCCFVAQLVLNHVKH